MIWNECKLYGETVIGVDALGNDITEPILTLITKARHTPWTDAEISLYGAEITKNEQRFIIHETLAKRPVFAEISGAMQEVTEVIDLAPRWTALIVKAYKE